jgi:hypothetical protein
VTRADWQQIAEERLLAAQALRAARLWASAYYIAGYAVEGGLKSCIVLRISRFPEVLFQEGNKGFSADCWTHDLEKLLELGDVYATLKEDMAANPALERNWEIVTKWSEKSRYQMKTQAEAEQLCDAIADSTNGVMQWLRVRW